MFIVGDTDSRSGMNSRRVDNYFRVCIEDTLRSEGRFSEETKSEINKFYYIVIGDYIVYNTYTKFNRVNRRVNCRISRNIERNMKLKPRCMDLKINDAVYDILGIEQDSETAKSGKVISVFFAGRYCLSGDVFTYIDILSTDGNLHDIMNRLANAYNYGKDSEYQIRSVYDIHINDFISLYESAYGKSPILKPKFYSTNIKPVV